MPNSPSGVCGVLVIAVEYHAASIGSDIRPAPPPRRGARDRRRFTDGLRAVRRRHGRAAEQALRTPSAEELDAVRSALVEGRTKRAARLLAATDPR